MARRSDQTIITRINGGALDVGHIDFIQRKLDVVDSGGVAVVQLRSNRQGQLTSLTVLRMKAAVYSRSYG
jgi:hypothetical protein